MPASVSFRYNSTSRPPLGTQIPIERIKQALQTIISNNGLQGMAGRHFTDVSRAVEDGAFPSNPET
jgi:hypothetical protein